MLILPTAEPPGQQTTLTDVYGQDHEFNSSERGTALIRHVRPHQVASLCNVEGWHRVKVCPVMFPSTVRTR